MKTLGTSLVCPVCKVFLSGPQEAQNCLLDIPSVRHEVSSRVEADCGLLELVCQLHAPGLLYHQVLLAQDVQAGQPDPVLQAELVPVPVRDEARMQKLMCSWRVPLC